MNCLFSRARKRTASLIFIIIFVTQFVTLSLIDHRARAVVESCDISIIKRARGFEDSDSGQVDDDFDVPLKWFLCSARSTFTIQPHLEVVKMVPS